MSAMRSSSSGELHELGLLAAVRAIQNGEVSSEVYVGKLLERASGHADFNAFITVRAAITVFPGEIYHVPRSWAERK
jgi:indoleacetamide hydrolase